MFPIMKEFPSTPSIQHIQSIEEILLYTSNVIDTASANLERQSIMMHRLAQGLLEIGNASSLDQVRDLVNQTLRDARNVNQ